MHCEIIMRTIKENRDLYNKLLKYLLYGSLLLLVFNIIYLQNSLIVFWIRNNTKYGSATFNNVTKYKYISEGEIDFRSVLIKVKDIKKSESNIFFIETTCATKIGQFKSKLKPNSICLNIRQACAIESAANVNINSMILILYSCPINMKMFKGMPSQLKQIFRYRNVKIVKLDLYKYFEGTPVDDLYSKRILETSLFPLEHTSDVLRFLTLWKFGGTYLDLDVICLRPINDLGLNFVGHELNTAIGSAIINVQENGIGLSFLTELLNYLNLNYVGDKWSENGPYLLTKTIRKLCNGVKVNKEDIKHSCNGFTIYRKDVLYPIPWYEWRVFFNETGSDLTLERIKHSYTVHLWNKHSHKVKVFVGSKQPYEILASQFCPLTHYELEKNHFVAF